MRFGSKPTIVVTGTASVCLLGFAFAIGQAGQEQRPQMAEEVFKNVQVLKGIPVDEFMDTMGMFSAATSMNCTDCHTSDSTTTWDKFGNDTPRKQTARKMMLMVNAINKDNFRGVRSVTCYTCHRGDQRPKVVPSLTVQYSAPVEDPNEVEIFPNTGGPSADQVFEKYIQALGGTQRLANLTRFVAKGTYGGMTQIRQRSRWKSLPELRLSAQRSSTRPSEIVSKPMMAAPVGSRQQTNHCR